MAEEEHDVYGAEIPDETEMDGDFDSHYDDDDMSAAVKEEEATALRQMQATMTKDLMSAAQDPATAAVSQENKEGVDYACTPEEVQQHFQSCGSVNRVTILTDKFGQPKGFAYVEFSEAEAVQEALALNETELHGRQLKVMPKRTNVPGMKQFRPRRYNPYMGYHFRRPYVPYNFYSPYGYGKVPRFRRPGRYMSYY